MAGNTTFTPGPAPMSGPGVSAFVARYTGYRFAAGSPPDPDKDADPGAAAGKLALLPNIRPVKARRRQGADPGSALFKYILGDKFVLVDPDWPSQPEQVLGFDRTGPYNVRVDDRVCLFGIAAGGQARILFDGFVQLPSANIDSDLQEVSFQALGTPIRCWDYPLWGAVYRSAADPAGHDDDRIVEGPIRFNPDGLANATDADADGRTASFEHPCFLDPDVCADRKIGRRWTVSMAARYILARGNRHQAWVAMPGFDKLVTLLDGKTPKEGSDTFDPNDPATYDSRPIVVDDMDVAGLPWPEALAKLIEPHGFTFRFALGLDGAGRFPEWKIEFGRADVPAPGGSTSFALQPAGEWLDPALSQVQSFRLTRDAVDAANEFLVECQRTRREASFVLAPGFTPDPADAATPAAMDKFRLSHPDHLAVVDKYRSYVYDEAGDGHYNRNSQGAGAFVTGRATKLLGTLGGPDRSPSRYAIRRRPILARLFTRDGIDPLGGDDDQDDDDGEFFEDGGEADGRPGRPLRPQLHVSVDYKGDVPGEWDGTGTWYRITAGWRRLEDRLGIYCTAEFPEAWSCGNPKIGFGVALFSSGGSIKGISSQAKAGETRPIFRLTGVIEGDEMIDAIAKRRGSSPTRFVVRRYVEGREKYHLDRIEKNSAANTDGGLVLARWDQGAAMEDAANQRSRREMPNLAGPVVIPRITNAYEVGQFAEAIRGREISLRMNIEVAGEAARYPRIVEITYQFEPEQSTTLQLGDVRGAPDGS